MGPMRRRPVSLLALGLVAAVPLAPLVSNPTPAAADPTPMHTLVVSGAGVASYPAFDPAVERYAVTTTAATGGTITVQATTTDPAGVVRVDGRVAPGGTATVTGLGVGDEVAVFIEDSAGAERHSLIYLPAGFPTLESTATPRGLPEGQIGLTFFKLFSTDPRFAATVDRNGVPSHVEQVTDSIDLKRQPDGSISMTDPATGADRTNGWAISVRDDQWQEVRRVQTAPPLANTDQHDSVLLPDGRAFLLAYEPNLGNNTTDAVIQEIDAQGDRVWSWSSAGLEDESVTSPPGSGRWDYAHVNSVQALPDGDVVASFRHLSAVLRIATTEHDGYLPGDIVWRFGGRASDFAFVDDPLGGPCAQHTATLLPDNHLLVFDDGSGGLFTGPMCVDPDDPGGATHVRTQSRAAEWALDPEAGTATLVWSYAPTDWYSFFMGSARRLHNGDTLIGWADDAHALASEVDALGRLRWELREADTSSGHYISYRAQLMDVRDAVAPQVEVTVPEDGATYQVGQRVLPELSCTDRGGSSLQRCGAAGEDVLVPLDTGTPGEHSVDLVGVDGDGNTTTVTRHYTVTATYHPDWLNHRVHRTLRGEQVGAKLRLLNTGSYADSFQLQGPRSRAGLRVRYLVAGQDVTQAVRHGRFRTDLVAPGRAVVVRVVVVRTPRARAGARAALNVGATSVADPLQRDLARVVVKVRA